MTRLNKKIAQTGAASRRKAEELIAKGRVTVNGDVVTVPYYSVPEGAEVAIDLVPIKQESAVIYILNKPVGYHCTSDPSRKPKRAIDLIDDDRRLFTVGRLDRDTSGLLLVTNDGGFANEVMHPRYGIKKEYLVKTNCEITPAHLERLLKGITIEGDFIKPVKVRKVRRGTVKITVGEGKKHEVRLLCGAANLKVKELKRIRIGALQLGTLPEGGFRKMSKLERKNLFG